MSLRDQPTALLTLVVLLPLDRVIYFALDPIFLGRVLNGVEAQFLLTISYPAGVITTLLVALYWYAQCKPL